MTTILSARPEPVTDPWSVDRPGRTRRRWPSAVVALVLGSSGVLLRLSQLGVNARRAGLVLLVAAVLWEVVLRTRGGPVRVALLLGVAAVAEVVSAPSGGRAPAVLLLCSVTVADAALVDWSPTARWPRRQVPVAALAVLPVAGAQVAWYRTGSIAVMGGLLVLALAVVELYHRVPAAVGPVDRGVRRAVGLVADAVGGAALFVVAVPVLYLTGLVGRVLRLGPSGSRRRRGAARWQAAADRAVADASVPFSSPPPAVRRRRHLGSLGVVVVVGVLVTGAVVLTLPRSAPPPAPPPTVAPPGSGTAPATRPTRAPVSPLDLLAAVPYSQRPAFAGDRWADGLQQDLSKVRLVPDARTRWGLGDAETATVNVRNGSRRTVAPPCPGCRRATVWLVGASTAFGIGQRDGGTVASGLARRAAADGIALDVVNLGVPGWTVHQETEDLLARLGRGAAPPDVVVSLDGFNDAMAAVAREVTGVDDGSPLVFDEGGVLDVLDRPDPLGPERVRRAVSRATGAVRAERGRVAAALAPRQVPFVSFFQPDAFASPRQLAGVRQLYRVLPGLLERTELDEVLRGVVTGLAPEVTSLRDAYDGVDEPLMMDVVHTNERGADLLAAAMYRTVRPLVEERAR